MPRAQRLRWRANWRSVVGHIGEDHRILGIADPVALLEHRPGERDVLAHHRRPAADLPRSPLAVEREGALRHQRAVIHALHPLHGGNAVEIVPQLRAGDHAGIAIAHQHRAGHGLGAGRVGQEPADDLAQRLGQGARIGIDRADEIVAGERQCAVERLRLALIPAEIDQPHGEIGRQRQRGDRLARALGGGVGRTVVDDEHFERAFVMERGDIGERRGDAVFLIIGRDEHGDARIGKFLQPGRPPVEQQRGNQEGVHEAGDESDERDDQRRHDRRGERGEVVEPGQREPDRQGRPCRGDRQRDKELEVELEIEAPEGVRRRNGFERLQGRLTVHVGLRPATRGLLDSVAVHRHGGGSGLRRLEHSAIERGLVHEPLPERDGQCRPALPFGKKACSLGKWPVSFYPDRRVLLPSLAA